MPGCIGCFFPLPLREDQKRRGQDQDGTENREDQRSLAACHRELNTGGVVHSHRIVIVSFLVFRPFRTSVFVSAHEGQSRSEAVSLTSFLYASS